MEIVMSTPNQISPDELPRADFASIPRYSAGAALEIDLGDNTNQWGAPPAASAVLREGLDVSRYPDMYGDSLKRTIAKMSGFGPECIVTGNGSDDVLDCVIRAFASPGDTVAHADPTFVMVPVFSRINGITPVAVPLAADFSMDAEALLRTNARIIYLCSPNNPTATPTSVETIRRIIAGARGLVIIDEAYVDFTGLSGFLSEAPGLERVVVCRTLSKAYGLAGLRVGYARRSKHSRLTPPGSPRVCAMPCKTVTGSPANCARWASRRCRPLRTFCLCRHRERSSSRGRSARAASGFARFARSRESAMHSESPPVPGP